MSLQEQYPSLGDEHSLRDVMTAVLRKHGIVPDSAIVSDLTQAAEAFIHGSLEAAVAEALKK